MHVKQPPQGGRGAPARELTRAPRGWCGFPLAFGGFILERVCPGLSHSLTGAQREACGFVQCHHAHCTLLTHLWTANKRSATHTGALIRFNHNTYLYTCHLHTMISNSSLPRTCTPPDPQWCQLKPGSTDTCQYIDNTDEDPANIDLATTNRTFSLLVMISSWLGDPNDPTANCRQPAGTTPGAVAKAFGGMGGLAEQFEECRWGAGGAESQRPRADRDCLSAGMLCTCQH